MKKTLALLLITGILLLGTLSIAEEIFEGSSSSSYADLFSKNLEDEDGNLTPCGEGHGNGGGGAPG
jgi:hypothetical protein